MSDFENFLSFSSAMARCDRMGSAEAQYWRLRRRETKENAEERGREEREKRLFPLTLLVSLLRNLRSCASALTVQSHRAIAEEKQRKFSKSLISSDH